MSIVGVTASSRRQVPNAPTIGTATDVGTARAFNNGAAVVTFTPSAIGFEATSYTVTSSPGGFTATGASSPLTVTGLQSNTAYTFTATATNFVGTGSASSASNSITATTVPQAPTIGTPTLANGQAYTGSANIGVVFTANATGGKAITTFTATSSSAAAISGATSPITVSDTVGNARTYTVTAANANGTSLASSASASITPSSVPQAPTINSVSNVAGRPVNSPQASVAFTANATGGSTITGFTVTSSSGATNTGATSPILVTESAAGTYTYTVTATNARGTSLASTGLGGGVSSVPNAPTIGTLSNVTGIAFGSNPQFTLTFTAPTSTGGSAITSYKYSTNGGTNYITAPGTTSPMTLTTQSTSGTPAFVAGTNYTVILIAVNANGDSPASAASNSQTAATIPSTPTFTLSSTGATNITGTYSYNTGGLAVTSYTSGILPVASQTVGGTSPVGNTSGALTFTASYAQGTQYTVAMNITNPIGTAYATSQTITPYAAATPGAPATLTAAVASTTSVTLTYGAIAVNGSALTAWQGTGTSTGDIVSTPAIALTYSGTPSAAGSTVTVTGAFAATQSYTFTLKARNGAGLGAGITSNGVVPLPTITDNFNRSGASLGTTSSGSAWTTHSGAWSTTGTQGSSSSTGVASVSFGNNSATVTADVTNGYGVSWWVSGSGSYYSSFYQQYTYTYSTGANYCVDCYYNYYSCNAIVGITCSGVGNGNGLYYNGNCYTCPSGWTFDQSTGACKYCSSGTAVCPTGTTEYNGSCYSCSSGTLTFTGSTYQCQTVSGSTGNGVYQYDRSATTYGATVVTRYCNATDAASPTVYGCPYTNYSTTCYDVNPSTGTGATGALCSTTCSPGTGAKSTATALTCYDCGLDANGPNPSTGSGSIASCYVQGTMPTYTYSSATVSAKVSPSGGTWPNCNYTTVSGPPTNQGQAIVTSSSGGTYPNCTGGGSPNYSIVNSSSAAVAAYPTCGCLADTATRVYTNGGGAITPTATATGNRIMVSNAAGTTFTGADLSPSVPTKITAVVSAAGSWTVYAYNSSGTQIFTTTGTGTPVGNYGIFKGTSAVTNGTGLDNFSVS
jgi:hypothetical protein